MKLRLLTLVALFGAAAHLNAVGPVITHQSDSELSDAMVFIFTCDGSSANNCDDQLTRLIGRKFPISNIAKAGISVGGNLLGSEGSKAATAALEPEVGPIAPLIGKAIDFTTGKVVNLIKNFIDEKTEMHAAYLRYGHLARGASTGNSLLNSGDGLYNSGKTQKVIYVITDQNGISQDPNWVPLGKFVGLIGGKNGIAKGSRQDAVPAQFQFAIRSQPDQQSGQKKFFAVVSPMPGNKGWADLTPEVGVVYKP